MNTYFQLFKYVRPFREYQGLTVGVDIFVFKTAVSFLTLDLGNRLFRNNYLVNLLFLTLDLGNRLFRNTYLVNLLFLEANFG